MQRILSSIFLAGGLVFAQTPVAPAPTGDVVGVGNLIHIVADAERSVHFYHDVLGLDLQRPPNAPDARVPGDYQPTPQIVSLYNAIGGQFRVGVALVPENPMRAELVEWKGVDRKPVAPHLQEPGAVTMIFTVRQLDPILPRLKEAGTPIITTGGTPVEFMDGKASVRGLVVKDPDGFYVELQQRDPAPPSRAPGTSNFIDVGFQYTVSDADRMVSVFRDALGFQLDLSAMNKDASLERLWGAPGARFRRATALVPGTTFPVTFLEFAGAKRQAAASRPQDPGSALFRLRVQDVDAVLKSLKASGATVASEGGKPVTLAPPGLIPVAVVRMPDNLFIQVMGQPRPAPPAAAGSGRKN